MKTECMQIRNQMIFATSLGRNRNIIDKFVYEILGAINSSFVLLFFLVIVTEESLVFLRHNPAVFVHFEAFYLQKSSVPDRAECRDGLRAVEFYVLSTLSNKFRF